MIYSGRGYLRRKDKGRRSLLSRRGPSAIRSSSGAASAVDITADALHWFDFSDTSTLWQVADRTVPVTANNDPIGYIDNKGSDGTDLIQGTSARRPLWLSGHVNGLGCANFVTGSLQHLDNPITTGLTYPGSVLVVGNTNGTTGAHCMFAWGGSRMQIQFTAAELVEPFMSVTALGTSATAPTLGATIAVYCTDDGANAQTADYSFNGEQDTSAGTSSGPGASAAMAIGENGSLGAHHTGDVCEVLVWDNVKPLADIQAYVLDKWGISWA